MDEKKFDLIISFIFSILQLILWILSLIWLCKVNKNAKDEPANRSLYYNGEEISEFYIIGDFCYEHFQPYVDVGAFEDLDIRMKSIRVNSKALIIIIFISFILSIFLVILRLIKNKLQNECWMIFISLAFALSILCSFISIIVFIVLSRNYFNS